MTPCADKLAVEMEEPPGNTCHFPHEVTFLPSQLHKDACRSCRQRFFSVAYFNNPDHVSRCSFGLLRQHITTQAEGVRLLQVSKLHGFGCLVMAESCNSSLQDSVHKQKESEG